MQNQNIYPTEPNQRSFGTFLLQTSESTCYYKGKGSHLKDFDVGMIMWSIWTFM